MPDEQELSVLSLAQQPEDSVSILLENHQEYTKTGWLHFHQA